MHWECSGIDLRTLWEYSGCALGVLWWCEPMLGITLDLHWSWSPIFRRFYAGKSASYSRILLFKAHLFPNIPECHVYLTLVSLWIVTPVCVIPALCFLQYVWIFGLSLNFIKQFLWDHWDHIWIKKLLTHKSPWVFSCCIKATYSMYIRVLDSSQK